MCWRSFFANGSLKSWQNLIFTIFTIWLWWRPSICNYASGLNLLWSLLITYKYCNKIFKIELKHSKNGKNALMKVYIAQIVYFVSFVCIVNVCLYCLICPYCLHCQYCQYFLNALHRKYMFLYCLVLCCIILTLNIGQVLKLGKSCEIWSKQTKTQANEKNQKYSRNTWTQ